MVKFSNIGFVISRYWGQVEDGELSSGNFYITRSWEEDPWGPGWLSPHPWRDPGSKFWFLAETQLFLKKTQHFRENNNPGGRVRHGSRTPRAPWGPWGAHGGPKGTLGGSKGLPWAPWAQTIITFAGGSISPFPGGVFPPGPLGAPWGNHGASFGDGAV